MSALLLFEGQYDGAHGVKVVESRDTLRSSQALVSGGFHLSLIFKPEL
jgi:hypothetical protein